MKRTFYYVDGGCWFVTAVKTKRRAKSLGVAEFGRGQVRVVREATDKEVKEYCYWKGTTRAKLIEQAELHDE